MKVNTHADMPVRVHRLPSGVGRKIRVRIPHLLFHPSTNKSTAFKLEERRRLDLREHILTQMYGPSYSSC